MFDEPVKFGEPINIRDATSRPAFMDLASDHPVRYRTTSVSASMTGPVTAWPSWSNEDWTVVSEIMLPEDHPYYANVDFTKPVEVYNSCGFSAPAIVTERYPDGSARVRIPPGEDLDPAEYIFKASGTWFATPPNPENQAGCQCRVRNRKVEPTYVWLTFPEDTGYPVLWRIEPAHRSPRYKVDVNHLKDFAVGESE